MWQVRLFASVCLKCRCMVIGIEIPVNILHSCSEFLATDTEVPGSIPGATRFSE